MTNIRLLIATFLFMAITVPIAAAGEATPDVSYLDVMPDVSRVLQDHADPNPLKEAALQNAALEAIRDAIRMRTWQGGASEPRNRYRLRTPAEEAKYKAYHEAWQKAHARLYTCKAPACDVALAKQLWGQQGKMRRIALEKYFKGPWLDEHNRILKARLAEMRERRQ